MKAPEIPPIQLSDGVFGQHPQHGNQQLAKAPKPRSSINNSDTVTPSPLNHVHFSKLENTKAQFHGVAQKIRSAEETLTSVSSHLVHMREALESVVKIYPPYPPGSSERIEALRQFAALRNMIDRLAAPTHAESEDHLNIDPYTVPAGKGGLDIPHLGADSSDQQIHDAIDKVAAAQDTMDRRFQQFVSFANGLIAEIR